MDAISVARIYQPNLPLLALSPAWTRLEPQSRSGDPAVGLAAEVADPLWLLGRQWQLGEWAGEDVGTPLTVEVLADAWRLTHWQPGRWRSDDEDDDDITTAAVRELPNGVPWEQLVEPEPAADSGERARAEAAATLVATLRGAGWDDAAQEIVARHPAPASDDEASAWRGPALVLAGRAADAEVVAAELESAGGPPDWLAAVIPTAGRERAAAALEEWRAWYRAEVAPTTGGPDDAWVGRRLEHAFSLAGGGAVLRAPAYQAGNADRGIDWWSCDLDAAEAALTPDADLEPPVELRQTLLATPLTYPGMPAARFWEMEDADVDLGSVGADPHDLARLLVIECGLVYGGDWLVLPFDVPAGTYVRLRAVTYRTTFGERFVVGGVADPAAPAALADEPWRMWATTVAGRSWEERRPGPDERAELTGLLVPPTFGGRLEGPPLEDVLFLRDEAANLVWGVERILPLRSGDAAAPGTEPASPPPAAPPGDDPTVLDYEVQSTIPRWWIPYLPTSTGYATVELVRGAMVRYDHAEPEVGHPIEPAGRLLQDPAHAVLDEAEVPREGVRVQRIPVVGRDGAGNYSSWTVRRVTVGRGEGHSGLAFDAAVPRR